MTSEPTIISNTNRILSEPTTSVDNFSQTSLSKPVNGRATSTATLPVPNSNVWVKRTDQRAPQANVANKTSVSDMAATSKANLPVPIANSSDAADSSSSVSPSTSNQKSTLKPSNHSSSTPENRMPTLQLSNESQWPEVGKQQPTTHTASHSPLTHAAKSLEKGHDKDILGTEGSNGGSGQAPASGGKKSEKTKWIKMPPEELQAAADSQRASSNRHRYNHNGHSSRPPHSNSHHPNSSRPHSQSSHSNPHSQQHSERSSPRHTSRPRGALDESSLSRSLAAASYADGGSVNGRQRGGGSQTKSLRSSAAVSPANFPLPLPSPCPIPVSLPFSIPPNSSPLKASKPLPKKSNGQRSNKNRSMLSRSEAAEGVWYGATLKPGASSSSNAPIFGSIPPGTAPSDDYNWQDVTFSPAPVRDADGWYMPAEQANGGAARRFRFGKFGDNAASRGSSRRSSFGEGGHGRLGHSASSSGGYNTPVGLGLHLTVPRGDGRGGRDSGRSKGGRGGRGRGGHMRQPGSEGHQHGSSSPSRYGSSQIPYDPTDTNVYFGLPGADSLYPPPPQAGYYLPPSGAVNYLAPPFVPPYGYPLSLPLPPAAMPYAMHGPPTPVGLTLPTSGAPIPVPITNPGFPLDPLRYYLLGQVEYYMSFQNLCADIFLRRQMDSEGWIDIHVIAAFNRIRQLTPDVNLVRDAISLSSLIELSGDKIRLANQAWKQFVLPEAKPSTVASSGHPITHGTHYIPTFEGMTPVLGQPHGPMQPQGVYQPPMMHVEANEGTERTWADGEVKAEDENASTTTVGSQVNGTMSPATSVEGAVGGKILDGEFTARVVETNVTMVS